MSKNKSRELPVLSIAFVTGEEIEPRGLPKLKVYEKGEDYILAEGQQEITSALLFNDFIEQKRESNQRTCSTLDYSRLKIESRTIAISQH